MDMTKNKLKIYYIIGPPWKRDDSYQGIYPKEYTCCYIILYYIIFYKLFLFYSEVYKYEQ